jgi:ABC-2 type transport system ATP-binding protein
MNILEVNNLTKSYGNKKVVNQVSFEVKKGEIFGLLGPNGAGKSTTIEIIAGLKKSDAGNSIISTQNKTKVNIGVQLQSTDLYRELTVKETLLFFLNLHDRGETLEDYIELTKLQQVINTRVKNLSGGQKQRLSLSLALVSDPEIVILDEPTVGLDPQSRRNLWDVISKLKDLGKTIVLTTHFMDEAEQLCDRIAIIDHGELIALDTPNNLIKQIPYRHTFTVSTIPPLMAEDLKNVPYEAAHCKGDLIIIHTNQVTDTLMELLQMIGNNNIKITSLKLQNANLEELFLFLTGKEFRD